MLENVVKKEKNLSLTLLESVREKCQKYIDLFDYESAYFWAEKELALAIDLHNMTRDDKIKPFNSSKFPNSRVTFRKFFLKFLNFTSANWLGVYSDMTMELIQALHHLLRCFILSGQFARAVYFINSNKLQMKSKQFFYFLLYCQAQMFEMF